MIRRIPTLPPREIAAQAARELRRRADAIEAEGRKGNDGLVRLHLGAVAYEANGYRRELERVALNGAGR